MSTHDGHRKRLRDRYNNEGLDNFQPHEALELLLMHAIPRKDTNATAHALLDYFGNFANVLEARQEQLCMVEGVGEKTAALIKLVVDCGRRYQLSKFGDKAVLDTTEKLAKYCMALEFGRQNETFYMICLNAKKRVIKEYLLEEGTIDRVTFYVTKILERAMACKAHSVAIAHNHPGGDPLPSQRDVQNTHIIARALRDVDILFEDHIIIGDEENWVSAREKEII